jgi:hypothetical protein
MISIKVHNFFVGFLVLLIFESKANAFFIWVNVLSYGIRCII